MQKPVQLIPVPPPPDGQRRRRAARFAAPGERRDRYHLPERLESSSPVGYRRRLPLTQAEADQAARLLSLEPPRAFVPGPPLCEGELFEELSLGVLSARQSTNYRGHRQVVLGPQDSERLLPLLARLQHTDRPPLANAAATHVVLSRPAVRTVDLDSDVAAALTARSAPTLRLLSPRESVGHWSPPGIAWVW